MTDTPSTGIALAGVAPARGRFDRTVLVANLASGMLLLGAFPLPSYLLWQVVPLPPASC